MPAGLARQLATAHRTGEKLGPPPPALVPRTEADAFAIQARVLTLLGEGIAGRKVAMNEEGVGLGAVVMGSRLLASGGRFPVAGVGLELEIAIRLGRDLPPPEPGRAYTRADVMAAIDGVAVALELCVSRFLDPKSTPFRAFLADAMSNGALVVGAMLPPSSFPDLAKLTGRVTYQGAKILNQRVSHPRGDPLAPVVAYCNLPAGALGGPMAGEIITTGSLCGLLPLDRPGPVIGELTGLGTVEVVLE